MTITGSDRRTIPYVDAEVSFYDDLGRPESFVYTYGAPEGQPAVSGREDVRRVRVQSGWDPKEEWTLDTHGFAIRTSPTSFNDWYNQEAVLSAYYDECVKAVLAVSGADRGVAFDHNVRNAPKADLGFWSQTVAKPTQGTHNDYTDRSAPGRAQEILGEVPSGRYAYINLWRPILEPLRDSPLAVIDGRTLRPDDVVLTELRYPDRSGWIHRVRFNPEQRWIYFPDMAHQEALFLKCWDSVTDGRVRHTAHSAFDDPSIPEGSPPRESLEVRVIAMWD